VLGLTGSPPDGQMSAGAIQPSRRMRHLRPVEGGAYLAAKRKEPNPLDESRSTRYSPSFIHKELGTIDPEAAAKLPPEPVSGESRGESVNRGPRVFMSLGGIPFVLIGQHLLGAALFTTAGSSAELITLSLQNVF